MEFAGNLDGMNSQELYNIWARTSSGPEKLTVYAKELFPTEPEGYLEATRKLGYYAYNKMHAINNRLALHSGSSVAEALKFEAICDEIYEKLPEYAQW